MGTNVFGAAPSLAGYQWQLHQAFVALIDAPSDGAVSLEELDDVVTHRRADGVLETAIARQTKHSLNDGSLGPKSVDLWKTLRVWAWLFADPARRPDKFVLATTDALADALVCLNNEKRPPEQTSALQQVLDGVAAAKANANLQEAFNAWEALASADRASLLARIQVEAAQPRLAESTSIAKDRLKRTGLTESQTDFAYEYMLGWFTGLVQQRLTSGGCRIERAELQDKLVELHALCRPGSLTSLHAKSAHPSLNDERASDPTYLQQLDLLDASEMTLEVAVAMLHRARAERNSWLQRNVTGGRDLDEFDGDLENKWLQLSAREAERADPEKARGWRIYQDCMSYDGNLRGMPVAVHVANGSFHILANGDFGDPTVGWHPNFRILLQKKNK